MLTPVNGVSIESHMKNLDNSDRLVISRISAELKKEEVIVECYRQRHPDCLGFYKLPKSIPESFHANLCDLCLTREDFNVD